MLNWFIFRGNVYAIFYDAVVPTVDVVCPDFQKTFMDALTASVGGSELLTTVSGIKIAVSAAKLEDLVLKSTCFSVMVETSLSEMKITLVETAIAAAWKNIKGGIKFSTFLPFWFHGNPSI